MHNLGSRSFLKAEGEVENITKTSILDKPQNRYSATPWRPQELQELENDQK